ncbi:MAG: hypothetical protein INQ03_08150 [Candidatus Heimdallarchaeota archaeon]|nr:hypothetical protein [Candidatus Heimdallarchaeota archaeon]
MDLFLESLLNELLEYKKLIQEDARPNRIKGTMVQLEKSWEMLPVDLKQEKTILLANIQYTIGSYHLRVNKDKIGMNYLFTALNTLFQDATFATLGLSDYPNLTISEKQPKGPKTLILNEERLNSFIYTFPIQEKLNLSISNIETIQKAGFDHDLLFLNTLKGIIHEYFIYYEYRETLSADELITLSTLRLLCSHPILGQKSSKYEKFEHLLRIGSILQREKRNTEAFTIYNDLLHEIVEYNHPHSCLKYKLRAMLQLGSLYWIQKDEENAISTLENVVYESKTNLLPRNIGQQNLQEIQIIVYPAVKLLIDILLITGNYDKTKKHMEFLSELVLITNKPQDDILIKINQSQILRARGQFDNAIHHLHQAYDILVNTGSHPTTSAKIAKELGILFRYQRKYTESEEYLRLILDIKGIDLSETYYQLILTFLEANDIKSAEKSLESLKKLTKSDNILTLIAESLVRKSDGRLEGLSFAQKQLTDIFSKFQNNELHPDINLMITVMIHLIEILLLEMKISDNEKLEREMTNYLKYLTGTAYKTGSTSLILRIMLLKARISLIQENINQVEAILKDVEQLFEENELSEMQQFKDIQVDSIKNEVSKWKALSKKGEQLSKSKEKSDMKAYIAQVKQVFNI